MSITNSLLKSLKGDVYYAVQDGHGKSQFGETVISGKRHETLAGSDTYFQSMNLEHRVANFKYIMSMVRNPYEMEVSRFHYLRKGHEWDKGIAQKMAMSGNFGTFVANSKWWFKFRDYYTAEGFVPANLYIVRYENFEQTMQLNFASCFRRKFKAQRLNKSHNTNYREYYTKELESLVYYKYQWIFDKGYYARELFPRRSVSGLNFKDLSGRED